jgi:3-oxoacyl-[acyl-carrier protein] reductase
MGRQGDPPELGRLVAFLVSEENTYLTGQTLVVDGGLLGGW